MKNCADKNCQQNNPQPLENFGIDRKRKDGLYGYCKICSRQKSLNRIRKNPEKHNELSRIWRKNNPEKRKGQNLRKFWPGTNYKEALNNYNKLLSEQNGVCKVCKQPEIVKGKGGKIKELSVDHCHKTGKVRGLLCDFCNVALGRLKEDIEIIERLIKYLKGEL